ncbi:MAG TPA: agmatine deiminase family protein [Ignavibacteriaceae bacterium]|nr:agmatine deiminase family protein [Ignavibacteriaceae bacterium]
MKQLIVLFLLLILFSACRNTESDSDFYMPGQFEEQEAVWLGWQGYDPYFPVGADMIEALLPFVQIKVITESDSILQVCKKYLSERKIDTTKIKFYVIPDNEFWIRDHGAAFIINKNGEIQAVDFEWGTYGYRQWLIEKFNNDVQKADSVFSKSAASKRGAVDSLMAVADNIPVLKSWIVMEGGSIEVNGKGTLILNEPLTLSRNEGASKESIEQEFKRVLGVKNIIWLQHGLAEDPHIFQTIAEKYVGLGTGGHTDEFVKFADANTILLAWVDEEEKDKNPINRINYERMNVNYEILKNSKDENENSFKIIKVPLPDLITTPIQILEAGAWDDSYSVPISAFKESDGWAVGDTAYRVAASSYLNYYVTNGTVLLPTYFNHNSSSEKEEQIKKIFAEVFPGRKQIFIDAMVLNWEGGGIHCGTQQQPKK